MSWNFDRRGGRRKGEVQNGSFCPFQVVCIFFFFPPNRMKAYSHRPDQDVTFFTLPYLTPGTFFFFLTHFFFISPTYLPTYLLPFFSPFIRSPSLSRPAIRSRRSKLCNNTHPPNLRRHCTRRRDGNVSVAQRVGLDFVATRWGAGEIS